MASKIDVKIKLSSNVNVDSTSSGTTDDSNSNSGTKFDKIFENLSKTFLVRLFYESIYYIILTGTFDVGVVLQS